MDFIKQHGRYARKLRVADDPVAEDALSHHQDAGVGTMLAVEACGIADRSANRFAYIVCDALCRHTRGQSAWGKQKDLALAIRLMQQCRGNQGRFAGTRRRDKYRVRRSA